MGVEIWFSFILASLALCFTPGPTVLVVIGQSISQGRRSTLPLVMGVLIGDLIAMSLSLAGVGALLTTSAQLFFLVKCVGAAYLFYLGIKAWRKPLQGWTLAMPDRKAARGVFRESMIVTALNPKSIIFFMAFFPLFIDPEAGALSQLVILGTSFLLVSALSAGFYATFANRLKSKLHAPALEKRFNRLSGGMLMGAGAITATIKH